MQKLYKKNIEDFIRFIGDDPLRNELKDTPKKVLDSLEYCFSGYRVVNAASLIHPFKILEKTNDIVVIKGINFCSFCEHHILPIIGKVNIGYTPTKHITGISNIKKVVDAITKRLQIQERICSQIASAIEKSLSPAGVIIYAAATHMCTMCHDSVSLNVLHKTGTFSKNDNLSKEFFSMLQI